MQDRINPYDLNDAKRWGQNRRKAGVGDTPMASESDYGLTPAQSHAGLDKLWRAIGVTGVQSEDVFTLTARHIAGLEREVERLNASHECFLNTMENEIERLGAQLAAIATSPVPLTTAREGKI